MLKEHLYVSDFCLLLFLKMLVMFWHLHTTGSNFEVIKFLHQRYFTLILKAKES